VRSTLFIIHRQYRLPQPMYAYLLMRHADGSRFPSYFVYRQTGRGEIVSERGRSTRGVTSLPHFIARLQPSTNVTPCQEENAIFVVVAYLDDPVPSNRQHRADCLEVRMENNQLFCDVLCTTDVHNDTHTHANIY